MKIAILATHPIQYHSPLFSYLTKKKSHSIKVFYTLGDEGEKVYDKDFGIKRSWNLDLLSGYDFEFLKNTAHRPSSIGFWGIQNPEILIKLKEFNPNAILVFGWKHQSHLTVMRYFKNKVPIMFRGDSTTLDDAAKQVISVFFRYQFLKWVYKYVDYVLSPGKATDLYFQKSGFSSSKIIRAPHSIDNERFCSFASEESEQLYELKNRLLISNSDFVFLFAGKFIEKKNPILLIRAFELLAQKNNSIHLLLVGSGALEKKMEEQVASLPDFISKRIHLLPFQDQQQIKIIYRAANVFVLPSTSETWGLSVNESMASGIPVLVSNKCGCSFDLVKDGKNGLIFESNSLSDLYNKMEIICNPFNYQKFLVDVRAELENYSFKSFENALNIICNKIEN